MHHIGELNAIHAFCEGNGRIMRLHLSQLAVRAGHRINLSRIAAQAWDGASRVSFNTADAHPLAAVIAGAMGAHGRLDAEIAQAQVSLSPDAWLVYAAVAEKIGHQMVKLSLSEVAELRADVARGLVAKERAEGPVALTVEQRRLAGAPGGPGEKTGRGHGADTATPATQALVEGRLNRVSAQCGGSSFPSCPTSFPEKHLSLSVTMRPLWSCGQRRMPVGKGEAAACYLGTHCPRASAGRRLAAAHKSIGASLTVVLMFGPGFWWCTLFA